MGKLHYIIFEDPNHVNSSNTHTGVTSPNAVTQDKAKSGSSMHVHTDTDTRTNSQAHDAHAHTHTSTVTNF